MVHTWLIVWFQGKFYTLVSFFLVVVTLVIFTDVYLVVEWAHWFKGLKVGSCRRKSGINCFGNWRLLNLE